jgi:hypothetical protein
VRVLKVGFSGGIYTDGEEPAGSVKAELFLDYLKGYDSHGLLDP